MLVGYARVSTDDQDPSLQSDALSANGCERIFIETASGAQRERPQLTAAMDFLREGDALVVWKLDRLARSLSQLISTMSVLDYRGIALLSLTESLDTATPGGRLVFHVFGALAEFERAIIRERTKAGLAAAKARGRVGGRPRLLTDEDLQIARTLLANQEISAVDVARRLGVSVSTLYRHLPAAKSSARDALVSA